MDIADLCVWFVSDLCVNCLALCPESQRSDAVHFCVFLLPNVHFSCLTQSEVSSGVHGQTNIIFCARYSHSFIPVTSAIFVSQYPISNYLPYLFTNLSSLPSLLSSHHILSLWFCMVSTTSVVQAEREPLYLGEVGGGGGSCSPLQQESHCQKRLWSYK